MSDDLVSFHQLLEALLDPLWAVDPRLTGVVSVADCDAVDFREVFEVAVGLQIEDQSHHRSSPDPWIMSRSLRSRSLSMFMVAMSSRA